jgi:hypothetical protein
MIQAHLKILEMPRQSDNNYYGKQSSFRSGLSRALQVGLSTKSVHGFSFAKIDRLHIATEAPRD